MVFYPFFLVKKYWISLQYSLLLFAKQNLLTYTYIMFALPVLKWLQNKPTV